MSLKKFATAILTVAIVAAAALQASAESMLTLYYDPANGNLKLQNTTSSTQSFLSYDIITLGNGTLGDPSGQPGNVGFLTGTATPPTVAFPVSNTSINGYNGIYSQLAGANVGSSIFTLQPYAGWSTSNPIGPAGTYWDLGNVALPGMTQADLNTRFLTDPEATPPNFDATSLGNFLFAYQTGPTTFSTTQLGDIKALVAPVPEPSTYALAFAGLACSGFRFWKRRKVA